MGPSPLQLRFSGKDDNPNDTTTKTNWSHHITSLSIKLSHHTTQLHRQFRTHFTTFYNVFYYELIIIHHHHHNPSFSLYPLPRYWRPHWISIFPIFRQLLSSLLHSACCTLYAFQFTFTFSLSIGNSLYFQLHDLVSRIPSFLLSRFFSFYSSYFTLKLDQFDPFNLRKIFKETLRGIV